MASRTLDVGTLYPDGTTLNAYVFGPYVDNPDGTPPPAATATAVSSGGTVTFTGLADGTRYYAGLGTDPWRYFGFSTPAVSTSGGSGVDRADLVSLDRLATLDRGLSAAKHRRDYEDAAVFNEQWADLTAWTTKAGGDLTVSGGQVLKGSANYAARRALSVGLTGNFRIVGEVTIAKSGTGTGCIVGVTTNDDPTVLSGWTALGLDPVSGNPYSYFASAAGNTSGTPSGNLAAGTYKIVVIGDEQGVSFTITNAARSVARRFYRTRAQVGSIKHVFIYNDSTTGTVGQIGARAASPTIAPRTGVEGVVYTSITTKEPAGDGVRVELPPSYDSRVPAPVILWSHGFGDTELELMENPSAVALGKALLDAGFILVGTNNGGNTWGNQTAIDKLAAAYRYVRDHYNIGGVVLAGQSLGGLPTFNALARRVVPAAGAMVFEPNLNLRFNVDTPAIWSDGTYGPSLRAAYGIASDASNYAAVTAGFDPMLQPASAYRGVPILLASSPGDTLVLKASHADLMATKLAGSQRELDVVTTSGAHGTSTQFPTVEPVAFALRCVAA